MKMNRYLVQVKQMDYYEYDIESETEEEAIEKWGDLHQSLVEQWKQVCVDSDMDIYIY